MLRHFLSAEVRKAEEAIQEETSEQDFLRPHSPIHPHITSQFTVFTQKTVQKSQTVQLRGRSRGRGEADTSQLREGGRGGGGGRLIGTRQPSPTTPPRTFSFLSFSPTLYSRQKRQRQKTEDDRGRNSRGCLGVCRTERRKRLTD